MGASFEVRLDENHALAYITGAAGDLTEELGRKVLANMVRLTPVKTGKLRRSLRAEVSGSGASKYVLVGSSLPYAKHVDQGTSKMAAQPYLRPALLQARVS